jgi:hypothetical protein
MLLAEGLEERCRWSSVNLQLVKNDRELLFLHATHRHYQHAVTETLPEYERQALMHNTASVTVSQSQ